MQRMFQHRYNHPKHASIAHRDQKDHQAHQDLLVHVVWEEQEEAVVHQVEMGNPVSQDMYV